MNVYPSLTYRNHLMLKDSIFPCSCDTTLVFLLVMFFWDPKNAQVHSVRTKVTRFFVSFASETARASAVYSVNQTCCQSERQNLPSQSMAMGLLLLNINLSGMLHKAGLRRHR